MGYGPELARKDPLTMSDGPDILVVDDDDSIRAVLSAALEDEGLKVVQATNGAEALTLAEQRCPRVIFLDMRMPVMDGWTFAREYRTRPGPHAPIVVMTAAQNAQNWCREVDGDACLAKPFDLDKVFELVDRFAA
jgi:CheY-like chemotaxis protein